LAEGTSDPQAPGIVKNTANTESAVKEGDAANRSGIAGNTIVWRAADFKRSSEKGFQVELRKKCCGLINYFRRFANGLVFTPTPANP
jgi:hypothetical protein